MKPFLKSKFNNLQMDFFQEMFDKETDNLNDYLK